jgi:hypothetical protein
MEMNRSSTLKNIIVFSGVTAELLSRSKGIHSDY